VECKLEESRDHVDQWIYSNFTALNKGNPLPFVISKITSEILSKEGKWIPTKVFVGKNGGRNWYSNLTEEVYLKLDPLQPLDFAVCNLIRLEEPLWEGSNRVHKNFPQPLQIKIVFYGLNQERAEIITQQGNPKMEFITKEKRQEKHEKEPTLFYTQCDDTKLDVRMFAEVIAPLDSKKYVIVTMDNSRSNNLYLEGFQKLAYEAVKEQKTEKDIPDCEFKSDKGCTVKCSALVDLKKQLCYALKFSLQTNTSSSIQHYKLPVLEE